MATTQLRILGGKIFSYNDKYFKEMSEDGLFYSGNRWRVWIVPANDLEDGKIICRSEGNYQEGLVICQKEFPLKDGTVGLSGGNVRNRYAYFRTTHFQQFLDDFGVTAVRYIDPNQAYPKLRDYNNTYQCEQRIYTDGEVLEVPMRELEADEVPRPAGNRKLYSWDTCYIVKNATWVIVETENHYRDGENLSKVLYTNKGRKLQSLRNDKDFLANLEAPKVISELRNPSPREEIKVFCWPDHDGTSFDLTNTLNLDDDWANGSGQSVDEIMAELSAKPRFSFKKFFNLAPG
jgi:hypothetical protein